MKGIKTLENFITEKLKELNVVSVECVPGKLCFPEGYFEKIEKCSLCGKLC